MKKTILLLLLTFYAFLSHAQPERLKRKNVTEGMYMKAYNFYLERVEQFINDTTYNKPLTKIRQQDLKNFLRLMESARNAFKEKRFEGAFLILKTAEESKIVNKEFYMLLGLSTYYFDDKKIGERYLMRGYEKFNCLECKEVISLLY